MLRVGIAEKIPAHFLAEFPSSVEMVRIPDAPTESLEIDFWVAPFSSKVAKNIFPYLRGVKAVQTCTAGVDSVAAWLPKDITLCDAQGVHNISTSEWVVTALLATYKRLPHYRDLQNQATWKGQSMDDVFTDDSADTNGIYRVLGEDLHGKKILIVGYGSIGSSIEERLAPFGVEITRVARTAKPNVHAITELHALLPDADAVVLIVPLTPDTTGLIGAQEIALLKRGALLVNAARGPVVQTDALLAALNEHRIRAALDVTDPEPLPPEHPLWHAPNLLLTPHMAGSTPELIRRAMKFAAEQVTRYANGEPLKNLVTNAGY